MTAAVTNLVRLGVQLGLGAVAAFAIGLGLPALSSSVRDLVITAITGAVMALLNKPLNWLSQHFPWLGQLSVVKGTKPNAAASAAATSS